MRGRGLDSAPGGVITAVVCGCAGLSGGLETLETLLETALRWVAAGWVALLCSCSRVYHVFPTETMSLRRSSAGRKAYS